MLLWMTGFAIIRRYSARRQVEATLVLGEIRETLVETTACDVVE